MHLEHPGVVDANDLTIDNLGFGIGASGLLGLLETGAPVLVDEEFVFTCDDGEITGHAPNLPPCPLVAILCHSQALTQACKVYAVGGKRMAVRLNTSGLWSRRLGSGYELSGTDTDPD